MRNWSKDSHSYKHRQIDILIQKTDLHIEWTTKWLAHFKYKVKTTQKNTFSIHAVKKWKATVPLWVNGRLPGWFNLHLVEYCCIFVALTDSIAKSSPWNHKKPINGSWCITLCGYSCQPKCPSRLVVLFLYSQLLLLVSQLSSEATVIAISLFAENKCTLNPCMI